ncbi:hypothetical protein T4C_4922 [Trichinella pseudospiralis]|uniref:Uncharacterized protein n=1 Tax=Trichinella pseudospiralis TaxID=6337 RepID=A0A0V1JRM3_TRIPS|nr:hypothetical protein T4C_4922 [Trichinella pseudospiralis]
MRYNDFIKRMYFENCDVENGLIAWRSNVGRALRLPDEFAVRLHSSRRGALKFHQGVCQVTVGIVALCEFFKLATEVVPRYYRLPAPEDFVLRSHLIPVTSALVGVLLLD